MEDHGLAVGADLQIAFDARNCRRSAAEKADAVFSIDAAARHHAIRDARPAAPSASRGRPWLVVRRQETSNMPSTSTAASSGSTATPIGGARMPALVAESRHHQIGGAIHDLRAVEEVRNGS